MFDRVGSNIFFSLGSVLPDLHSTQPGEETAVPTRGNLRGTSLINLEWKSFTILQFVLSI